MSNDAPLTYYSLLILMRAQGRVGLCNNLIPAAWARSVKPGPEAADEALVHIIICLQESRGSRCVCSRWPRNMLHSMVDRVDPYMQACHASAGQFKWSLLHVRYRYCVCHDIQACQAPISERAVNAIGRLTVSLLLMKTEI